MAESFDFADYLADQINAEFQEITYSKSSEPDPVNVTVQDSVALDFSGTNNALSLNSLDPDDPLKSQQVKLQQLKLQQLKLQQLKQQKEELETLKRTRSQVSLVPDGSNSNVNSNDQQTRQRAESKLEQLQSQKEKIEQLKRLKSERMLIASPTQSPQPQPQPPRNSSTSVTPTPPLARQASNPMQSQPIPHSPMHFPSKQPYSPILPPPNQAQPSQSQQPSPPKNQQPQQHASLVSETSKGPLPAHLALRLKKSQSRGGGLASGVATPSHSPSPPQQQPDQASPNNMPPIRPITEQSHPHQQQILLENPIAIEPFANETRPGPPVQPPMPQANIEPLQLASPRQPPSVNSILSDHYNSNPRSLPQNNYYNMNLTPHQYNVNGTPEPANYQQIAIDHNFNPNQQYNSNPRQPNYNSNPHQPYNSNPHLNSSPLSPRANLINSQQLNVGLPQELQPHLQSNLNMSPESASYPVIHPLDLQQLNQQEQPLNPLSVPMPIQQPIPLSSSQGLPPISPRSPQPQPQSILSPGKQFLSQSQQQSQQQQMQPQAVPLGSPGRQPHSSSLIPPLSPRSQQFPQQQSPPQQSLTFSASSLTSPRPQPSAPTQLVYQHDSHTKEKYQPQSFSPPHSVYLVQQQHHVMSSGLRGNLLPQSAPLQKLQPQPHPNQPSYSSNSPEKDQSALDSLSPRSPGRFSSRPRAQPASGKSAHTASQLTQSAGGLTIPKLNLRLERQNSLPTSVSFAENAPSYGHDANSEPNLAGVSNPLASQKATSTTSTDKRVQFMLSPRPVQNQSTPNTNMQIPALQIPPKPQQQSPQQQQQQQQPGPPLSPRSNLPSQPQPRQPLSPRSMPSEGSTTPRGTRSANTSGSFASNVITNNPNIPAHQNASQHAGNPSPRTSAFINSVSPRSHANSGTFNNAINSNPITPSPRTSGFTTRTLTHSQTGGGSGNQSGSYSPATLTRSSQVKFSRQQAQEQQQLQQQVSPGRGQMSPGRHEMSLPPSQLQHVQEREQLQHERAELERERAELKRMREEQAIAKRDEQNRLFDLEMAQEELQTQRAELERARAETESQQQEYAAMQELQAQMEQDMEVIEQEKARLEKEKAEIARAREEIQSTPNPNDAIHAGMQQEWAAMQELQSHVEAEMEALEREKAELAKAREEAENQREELAAMQELQAQLEQDFETVEQEKAELARQQSEWQVYVQEQRQQLALSQQQSNASRLASTPTDEETERKKEEFNAWMQQQQATLQQAQEKQRQDEQNMRTDLQRRAEEVARQRARLISGQQRLRESTRPELDSTPRFLLSRGPESRTDAIGVQFRPMDLSPGLLAARQERYEQEPNPGQGILRRLPNSADDASSSERRKAELSFFLAPLDIPSLVEHFHGLGLRVNDMMKWKNPARTLYELGIRQFGLQLQIADLIESARANIGQLNVFNDDSMYDQANSRMTELGQAVLDEAELVLARSNRSEQKTLAFIVPAGDGKFMKISVNFAMRTKTSI